MKVLLHTWFIRNWPRKCVAACLAIGIWFLIDRSLTTTKTLLNVPIRLEHIPAGKTVTGIREDGTLKRGINLIITGNKSFLDELTRDNVEVLFDASGKQDEWIATVSKHNIRFNRSSADVAGRISKVTARNVLIKLTRVLTEKIPVIITQPIGKAPDGYLFLDIWPRKLYITVSGPEEAVKKLSKKGVKLTFNLNDISKEQLDDPHLSTQKKQGDVVSYFVPNHRKQVFLSGLSSVPFEINDPDMKFLRIDFLRSEMLGIGFSLPVSLFFPPETGATLNPDTLRLDPKPLLMQRRGLYSVKRPLFAKGVSPLFLEITKGRIELVITVAPEKKGVRSDSSIRFVNPKKLEDHYVRVLMSDASDREIYDLEPRVREEYLRSRFRSYMSRFELFTEGGTPFSPVSFSENGLIFLEEKRNRSPSG
ncbi:MAG: hypothetical protein OXF02_05555 [Simkaniaceae bacterium]|nr:hypothetical protein [Simkaniaceae bacterium]